LGETRARTFTNFDGGTVHFRHMGVLVSRICTIFHGESVLAIFASFDLDKYVRTCSIHTFEARKNLQNALEVEYGTNSTYEHSHMTKINSSSVKICESSRPRLARVSLASRPKILNCYPRRSIAI
jgi:hypothetical protein